ncbi:MAG TPA: MBL fold metallo-hydrolase [Alphaproteobacteria bacterium]|nr:MBL fold metallo-hydrolase [Alphaproteobacteria bacterium]
MKTLNIGTVTVDRVQDWVGPVFRVPGMWPASTWEQVEAQRDWLEPHFLAPRKNAGEVPEKDRILDISLHTYLVRTPKFNILIDTCVGNDRSRQAIPDWHMMNTDYLAKIAAFGISPEDVHYVMCTHLHFDHVGWNTKLLNGRWVPTFPNARYIFHKTEYDYWIDHQDHFAMDGAFPDSVLPIVEAGRADLVKGDFAIDDTIWLEPSPGHTPGHVCINLADGKDSALFTGDAFHHPLQVAYPEWSLHADTDMAGSAHARRKIIDKICDTDTYIMAAHFMDPTIARIVRNKDRWKLRV